MTGRDALVSKYQVPTANKIGKKHFNKIAGLYVYILFCSCSTT